MTSMRVVPFVIPALIGCGRLGFDAQGVGDGGPANGDGSLTSDGGSDAPTIVSVDAPGGGSVFRITASGDTALNSAATALNYGGLSAFNVRTSTVGVFVGLVHFDLTPLAGKTVTSATLEVRTTSAAFSGATAVRVYAVLEPWTEGSLSGGVGVANHTMRTAAQAWTAAGCGAGSRDTNVLGSFMPSAPMTTYSIPILAVLVDSWVDAPLANAGLVLVADMAGPAETAGFVSREGGDGAPTLVVIVP